jgi:hypothetical protein
MRPVLSFRDRTPTALTARPSSSFQSNDWPTLLNFRDPTPSADHGECENNYVCPLFNIIYIIIKNNWRMKLMSGFKKKFWSMKRHDLKPLPYLLLIRSLPVYFGTTIVSAGAKYGQIYCYYYFFYSITFSNFIHGCSKHCFQLPVIILQRLYRFDEWVKGERTLNRAERVERGEQN